MRIRLPHQTERFGAVRIHDVQDVLELDSGLGGDPDSVAVRWQLVSHLPYEVLNAREKGMAIVVPCKGERLKVLEGVLAGIPHDCLIVVVSASDRDPVDRYRMEQEAVTEFCQVVQRDAVLIHQRDPGLGLAFVEAGMPEIVADDGCVRPGKGEGMLVGVALARLAGRDAVGFVDADNYVPGAVQEYVKCYAAGLHLGRSPYTMVRISWRTKPKVEEERLFFHRSGRVSRVTNHFLNTLLGEYSGFATDVVATGNAGEHAMTMELAIRLRFAGGFAVEPHQFVELFERFGGAIPSAEPDVMKGGVDVFQIETRNPHLHEEKGDDHVDDMRLQALACLYHSPICPEPVREEIRSFLAEQGIGHDEIPDHAPIYPPLTTLDEDAFLRTLLDKADTFEQVERMIAADVVTDVPITVPDDGTPPLDR